MAVSALPSRNLFQTTTSTLNMRLENDRLDSFDGWPCPFLNPVTLAKAGFFYTKKEDVVRCAYCNVEIGKWEPGDNVVSDHKRWSPNCPFLKSIMPGEDVCGKYEFKPNSFPEGETRNGLQKLAIPSRKPTFPDFVVYESRLKSFKDWPKAMKQKPAELADAGFFYTGRGDQTLCFHCGGGLKGWEEGDMPWEQHAIWFPKCSYLLLKKTRAYVEQITTNQQVVEETPSKTTKDKDSCAFECKICYCKKDASVVFTPCRHMIACVDCAPALTKCPICRTALESVVRVFLS